VSLAGHPIIEGRLFTSSDLRAIVESEGISGLAGMLRQARGFFGVVATDHRRAIAAVDHVRSYPVFYGETPEALAIGNNASAVAAALGDQALDPQSVEEYLATSGFVMGSETLLTGVSQVLAGDVGDHGRFPKADH